MMLFHFNEMIKRIVLAMLKKLIEMIHSRFMKVCTSKTRAETNILK